MKTKKQRIIGGAVIVIALAALLLFNSQQQVFTSHRQLPVVKNDHVVDIKLEYYMGETQVLDCSDQQEALIHWYNSCKEVKTEVGTTSDCRITIVLKDGSEIYIWNLYSDEWVTVGYRDDEHYYQSNVYSEELAEFFISFREEIQANAVIENALGSY